MFSCFGHKVFHVFVFPTKAIEQICSKCATKKAEHYGRTSSSTHAFATFSMVYRHELSELCGMHGVSSEGTKEEMLVRLISSKTFVASLLSSDTSKGGEGSRKAQGNSISNAPNAKKQKNDAQKKTQTSYQAFCKTHRADVVAAGITKQADVTKKLSEMWEGDSSHGKAEQGHTATHAARCSDAPVPSSVQSVHHSPTLAFQLPSPLPCPTSSGAKAKTPVQNKPASEKKAPSKCRFVDETSSSGEELLRLPPVVPNNMYACTTRLPQEHVASGVFRYMGECIHLNEKKHLYFVMS